MHAKNQLPRYHGSGKEFVARKDRQTNQSTYRRSQVEHKNKELNYQVHGEGLYCEEGYG